MALKLPVGLISHADQGKAHGDQVTAEMLAEIRGDLDDGCDPAALWWTLAQSVTCCAAPEIAAVLASTLLKLAQQTN
jgi:hypothetical protein